jgi:hypothetical protein
MEYEWWRKFDENGNCISYKWRDNSTPLEKAIADYITHWSITIE